MYLIVCVYASVPFCSLSLAEDYHWVLCPAQSKFSVLNLPHDSNIFFHKNVVEHVLCTKGTTKTCVDCSTLKTGIDGPTRIESHQAEGWHTRVPRSILCTFVGIRKFP